MGRKAAQTMGADDQHAFWRTGFSQENPSKKDDVMRFRPLNDKTSMAHLVDEDTGIEFFEKDLAARVKSWTREGVDFRRYGLVFVFRDPRWTGPNGTHDIEFKAVGRERPVERKYENDPKVYRGTQIYGIDIATADFVRSFAPYTGGDRTKTDEIRKYVTAAILSYLGTIPDTEVNFT